MRRLEITVVSKEPKTQEEKRVMEKRTLKDHLVGVRVCVDHLVGVGEGVGGMRSSCLGHIATCRFCHPLQVFES